MSLKTWHQSMLDQALLKLSQVGNRQVVSLLVRYGARNFQECINSSRQTNHILAFFFLCISAQNGDSDAIKIILHQSEEEIMYHSRYDDLMKYRLILAPLLETGRFNLSIPIHIALTEGQIAVAGEIVRLSSSRPTSGVIDWHDLEVSHIDSSWFDIPGLTHLVYIGLSSNRLRRVPERVLDFKSLQKLQIHHNNIASLPPQLFNMTNLKVIDASFNKLVSLPEILMHPLTSSLENLNLANNRLTDLPGYFINSKIVVLDISSNRFSKVPECVVHLHRMNTLCLDNNIGIEFIPYEIGGLRNLTIFGIKGLPYLKNIPYKKDVNPLQFLKSRARSPQIIPHYDVAVYASNSYDICRDTVIQTVKQHSRRKHYSFLTYSTTEEFLSFQRALSLPCTVYVITWDCQAGQTANELYPIIAHLSIYAPNARIIVAACWTSTINSDVQSKTQDKISKSMWHSLEQKGVVTVLTICIDRDALVSRSNSLQYFTEILHRKGDVSAVHLNVPNSYTALQSMLFQHATHLKVEGTPPMINEKQLWELIRGCPHNDLAGHKELPILVSFLTDIAFVLCLPSNRNSESNIYILNRQWFMDALSGLLGQNQHVGNPSGLYPINSLCDLLNCHTLQTILPYAFCLFVSQLGLAIGVTSQKVLVPPMLALSNMESSADFSSQYEVRRTYTFRLIPQSFWGHLIAHLLINMDYLVSMTAIDNIGEVVDGIRLLSNSLPSGDFVNWNYWKEGLVVYVAGSSLLYSVEAIPPITGTEYREGLEIRVRSTPIGTKAMNMITTTINSLLRNWYMELWQTVEISVPCPQCIQDNIFNSFPFYECCKALANGNLDTLRCSQNGHVHSVSKLVPDLIQTADGQALFVTSDVVSFSIDDKTTCLSPPPSETIFKGEFGTMSVAIKPFPPPVPNGERSANPFLDFWHEYTIISHLHSKESNPYVIDFIVSIINPLALVFPYARFCSLEEVIQEKQVNLPPILRIRIIYQLAHAMEVLHDLKVIHRNVCLANIFVFSLSLDDTVNVKLGGFSDSCIALNQGLAIGEHGTFPAPEMSKYGYQYDERVDVFAFGFTSYEILSRRKLKFRGGVRFQAASSASDRPPLNHISKIAPHLATVIERCWNNDESKRPFFGEIIITFQNPLNIITREGEGINELQDFNAATVRFTRKENGTFKGDQYLSSSIFSIEDSATLSHLSLPGLTLQENTDLPSRLIISMCCTAQYLWISFENKDVRIYSTETLEFIKKIKFDHFVLDMAISPDAVYLGLNNGEVQMYNMSVPSPLHSPVKTRIISFQKGIESIQVLEDCIICCTSRSCIRIHPETLQPEQEFPVVSEAAVKIPVLCLDRENDEEYLWVSFKKSQELVIYNALNGSAMYGFNSCEVLSMDKSDVRVTSMLSVLDTVWVGMNTGHVLIFNAFSRHPHLLTYFKIHTEKVDRLLLLQPSYWGTNSPNYYYNDSLFDTDESDDGNSERTTYFLSTTELATMPQSMLVMSCGRGIEQKIPKIGSDGTIIVDKSTNNIGIDGSPPRLYLVTMDAPDSTGARKLESQANRPPVPYMENFRPKVSGFSGNYLQDIPNYDFSSQSTSHRLIPGTSPISPTTNNTSVEIRQDPLVSSYDITSLRDVPLTEDIVTNETDTMKKRRWSNFIQKGFKTSPKKSPNNVVTPNTATIETTSVALSEEITTYSNGSVIDSDRHDYNSDSDNEGKFSPYVSMVPVAIKQNYEELNTSLPR